MEVKIKSHLLFYFNPSQHLPAQKLKIETLEQGIKYINFQHVIAGWDPAFTFFPTIYIPNCLFVEVLIP